MWPWPSISLETDGRQSKPAMNDNATAPPLLSRQVFLQLLWAVHSPGTLVEAHFAWETQTRWLNGWQPGTWR